MNKLWQKLKSSRTYIYAALVGLVTISNELLAIVVQLEAVGFEHPYVSQIRVVLLVVHPFAVMFLRSITTGPVTLK